MQAVNCTDWTSMMLLPGGDMVCFGGTGDTGGAALRGIPGALIRGGNAGAFGEAGGGGQSAGVFALTSHTLPPFGGGDTGLRCGR